MAWYGRGMVLHGRGMVWNEPEGYEMRKLIIKMKKYPSGIYYRRGSSKFPQSLIKKRNRLAKFIR